ncbi:hypothetical protein NEOLEDRAFT_34056 [Neolentinus lepideus HHB14362 ss-1]|uniref:Uncharacterized protein n=1 Tax=Neolentinus lepideus HHB14362 ss-1 TaxID=1314782 RepID=A0A165W6U7_9AGAM|nr:hypothetical protein NEOLEDRAFT_34056 [Neolentinus lepideus HHB14362 ss-1]
MRCRSVRGLPILSRALHFSTLTPLRQTPRHALSLSVALDALGASTLLCSLPISSLSFPSLAMSFHLSLLLLPPLHNPRQVVRNPQVELRGPELDLAPHDLRPLVARGVDPADEVEVVHVLERAKVRAPFRGGEGDEPVVGAFFFEDDGVGPSAKKDTGVSQGGRRGKRESKGTHFHVSMRPGSYTAPQLKYFTPGISGVCSLNLRMFSRVRNSKALPSPPPFYETTHRKSA